MRRSRLQNRRLFISLFVCLFVYLFIYTQHLWWMVTSTSLSTSPCVKRPSDTLRVFPHCPVAGRPQHLRWLVTWTSLSTSPRVKRPSDTLTTAQRHMLSCSDVSVLCVPKWYTVRRSVLQIVVDVAVDTGDHRDYLSWTHRFSVSRRSFSGHRSVATFLSTVYTC